LADSYLQQLRTSFDQILAEKGGAEDGVDIPIFKKKKKKEN